MNTHETQMTGNDSQDELLIAHIVSNFLFPNTKRKRMGSLDITSNRIIYNDEGSIRSYALSNGVPVLGRIIHNMWLKGKTVQLVCAITSLEKVEVEKTGFNKYELRVHTSDGPFGTLLHFKPEPIIEAFEAALKQNGIRYTNWEGSLTVQGN